MATQKGRDYIQRLLLEDYLGIDIKEFTISHNKNATVILRKQKKLHLSDFFFSLKKSSYLNTSSLPNQPLQKLSLSKNDVFSSLDSLSYPIIYGTSDIKIGDKEIRLGLDIFGSCFFMLTRYEELVKEDRDQHGRFPASASLAYQEGFLERPIVDEYVEVLWCCMQYLWPDLKRKERTFKRDVSCDVDWPYSTTFRSMQGIAKRSIGNLVKRKSISQFRNDLSRYLKVQSQGIRYDEFYQFPFIMDELEHRNSRGTFYFIADNPAGLVDGIYRLDEPEIQELIAEIVERGHKIGLHPSYTTYQNVDQLALEKSKLEEQLSILGVGEEVTMTRQHFLRFDASQTFRLLDESGFQYDSSMGYPDHIGFRAGTCQPYRMFDLVAEQPIDLIQVPLLVMEVSMLSSGYMGLSHDEALSRVAHIVEHCKRHQGIFTFLWHNNQFNMEEDFTLYSSILDL